MKLNCWEYKNCGREAGGAKADEFGICPAYLNSDVHGVNGGKNGGRACWAIAGTMCNGKPQGMFVQKIMNCLTCDFYKHVGNEEGDRLIETREIMDRLVAAM